MQVLFCYILTLVDTKKNVDSRVFIVSIIQFGIIFLTKQNVLDLIIDQK
jgi:hypothetical protein